MEQALQSFGAVQYLLSREETYERKLDRYFENK
jgi:hypothetical protein